MTSVPQSFTAAPPAMPADLPAPVLSLNAETVLRRRYLRKDEHGDPMETPMELFWRVAAHVAAQEARYPRSPWRPDALARAFYECMVEGRFLPNSPTLMNAGGPLGQLAACFVLPVEDSIEAIFDTLKHAALIHKSGGGTGFAFSRLRPQNSRVGTTGGGASGPLSFMRIFNTATEQIKQGGVRRGANMGILRVDHPDILEFIKAKEKEGEFNNFNLSVALTQAFMEQVERGDAYELIDPRDGAVRGRLNAKDVFDLLVDKAWASGDPGIVFLDRINRDNPTPAQGEMEATNPCGEQPLLPYEACNLGSLNLAKYVRRTPEGPCMDEDALARDTALAVRFLDDVIDASVYPLEPIEATVRRNRKIGLGVMGWADALYEMGIPYDSTIALQAAERVMELIRTASRAASAELAAERGPFPAYEDSVYKQRGEGPYRNATTTTIAPTGTLSILAGCSSGVEPCFGLAFTRTILDNETFTEVNPVFQRALERAMPDQTARQAVVDHVATAGRLAEGLDAPEDLRAVFRTAMDIAPRAHLAMQAAFQRHTDNAVSKTVNLPNHATRDDIRAIYMEAYHQGVKGVTVYRDGSKTGQVLCTGEGGQKAVEEAAARGVRVVRDRPDVCYGFTRKISTGLGMLYLTVNEVDDRPFEVFATIGKSGRSVTAKAEAIGRLVSLALRSGIPVEDVVTQLEGIGGEHPVFRKKGMLLSIPDAVAWVLRTRYMDEKTPPPPQASSLLDKDACPECGGEIAYQEGCLLCQSCGYTKCG